MAPLAKQINIAYYWYEVVLHSADPHMEWPDVERALKNSSPLTYR